MSTVREQAIEAGARAYVSEALGLTRSVAVTDSDREVAAAVVDAVEPIIRADVLDYFATIAIPNAETKVRERLRAQVEALLHWDESGGAHVVEYDAVLDLLDGEPNG